MLRNAITLRILSNPLNYISAQSVRLKSRGDDDAGGGDKDFEKKDVEVFKSIFDKYDCRDLGSLDRWEFNCFVRDTLGRKLNDVDLTRIFIRIDRNKDERIQFDELLGHLRQRMMKPKEKTVRKAFNIFDKDSDGRLTLSETRLALLFLGEDYGNPNVRKVFIKLDVDNDGEINFKDFNKLLKDKSRKKQI